MCTDMCAAIWRSSAALSAIVVLALQVSPTYAKSSADRGRPPHSASTKCSDTWSAHIREAAKRFGIPERWLRAVMYVESVGDAHAISSKGAMGLMQIMPPTWEELRTKYHLGDDPFQPRDNILAGAAYLREMLDRFGTKGFLGAYNAGPARYQERLVAGRPLPRETIDYIRKLAPLINGSIALPVCLRSVEDRSSGSRSTIFPHQAHVRNDALALDADRPVDTEMVFTAIVGPQTSAISVTDLTAFEPQPAAFSVKSLSATEPATDSLFVQRASTTRR